MSKTDNKLYKNLQHYCRLNDVINFEKLLKSSIESVDLLYRDGVFFKFAVKNKASAKMLEVLLNYYDLTQQDKKEVSAEYKIAQQKLTRVLQEAIDSAASVSEEVQELVNSYSIKEESEEEAGEYLKDLDDIKLDYEETLNTQQNAITVSGLQALDDFFSNDVSAH